MLCSTTTCRAVRRHRNTAQHTHTRTDPTRATSLPTESRHPPNNNSFQSTHTTLFSLLPCSTTMARSSAVFLALCALLAITAGTAQARPRAAATSCRCLTARASTTGESFWCGGALCNPPSSLRAAAPPPLFALRLSCPSTPHKHTQTTNFSQLRKKHSCAALSATRRKTAPQSVMGRCSTPTAAVASAPPPDQLGFFIYRLTRSPL